MVRVLPSKRAASMGPLLIKDHGYFYKLSICRTPFKNRSTFVCCRWKNGKRCNKSYRVIIPDDILDADNYVIAASKATAHNCHPLPDDEIAECLSMKNDSLNENLVKMSIEFSKY